LQQYVFERACFCTDQTPTPTRFLHLGNQMGLFDEIKDNPFDREFKTAQKEVSYMLQNIDNVTYHNNGYY